MDLHCHTLISQSLQLTRGYLAATVHPSDLMLISLVHWEVYPQRKHMEWFPYSFTAGPIHSHHHKHLDKTLHDHSFLTIRKSQHQLNVSCELGIIYIFFNGLMIFPHFTMSEWNSHKLSLVHGYLKGQSQDSNQVSWVPDMELFIIHYWSWWKWWWLLWWRW